MKTFEKLFTEAGKWVNPNQDLIDAILELSKRGQLRYVKSKDFKAWAKALNISKEIRGMNQSEMYYVFDGFVANVWRPRSMQEAKAGDMSAAEIKTLVAKAFPKATDEELKQHFSEVYSWITRLPNTTLNVKRIKDIVKGV